MTWEEIFADKRKAIGEVAAVEGGKIDVLVYPEYYPKIRIGSILLFDSEYIKPIGIVITLLHRTRHGHITPLRKPRSEILKAYPDIDKYHKYVTTTVYTSHYENGEIRHYRQGMPRLHDLAFIVDGEQYLDQFFRPNGEWDLSFLNYYVSSGAGILEIKEFLLTHMAYIMSRNEHIDSFLSSLISELYKARLPRLSVLIEELSRIFSEYKKRD